MFRTGIRNRRIAIQGEPGSFSHEAALRMASGARGDSNLAMVSCAAGPEEAQPGTAIVPCPLSPEVFSRIVDGSVDAAVIPIENSLAGSVVEHYDLLFSHAVHIAEEALLRIRHTLIGPPRSSLAQVRRVYSHPVALAQCRNFFVEHPAIEAVPFYDTAGSVKHVLAVDDGVSAAIASREAARVYGALVLRDRLEDNQRNYTRFFLVLPGEASRSTSSEQTKVSVAFRVQNQPGTLVAALKVFADLGTNLTRLESRPIPGQPWHYIFYADYELPFEREGLDSAEQALRRLRNHCSVVKELGRYRPAALVPENDEPGT